MNGAGCNCGLLLYAADKGLIFQHMDINIIEQLIIEIFQKSATGLWITN